MAVHRVAISNLSDVLSNLLILDRALRDLSASRVSALRHVRPVTCGNIHSHPENAKLSPMARSAAAGVPGVRHGWSGVRGEYLVWQVGTGGCHVVYRWVHVQTCPDWPDWSRLACPSRSVRSGHVGPVMSVSPVSQSGHVGQSGQSDMSVLPVSQISFFYVF